MMKYIIVIFIFCITSCQLSQGYLIKYQVAGEATQAKIIYIDNGVNYEEVVALPWNKEIFIRDGILIGLFVSEIIGGEANASVLFIHNSGFNLYESKSSDREIIIKGVINSIL